MSACYERNDILVIGLGRLPFGHLAAAPEHHDAVGNFEDFGNVVADEDDGTATRGKPPGQRQDLACLGNGKRCLALRLSARQIATAWRWPPDRLPTGASGSEI